MTSRWQHWLLLMLMARVAAGTDFASPDNNYQALAHHQVWEAEGRGAVRVVAGLEAEGLADLLGHAAATPRFRVSPDSRVPVSDALTRAGLGYNVLIHDLASHFKEEQIRASREVLLRARAESCTQDSCRKPLTRSYMTFAQIEWYLKELAERSPRVALESIGKSIEGRDIWRVHIKPTPPEETTTTKEATRTKVWLEGGLHAREWISPAVTLHLIRKIVADTTITQKLDVYVVPVANPDGYVYSWTTDRMWRKNRRPNEGRPSCGGVDLNRNWDVAYGVGASSVRCSEVYKGTEAFSEPETQALRDSMLSVASGGNLRLVLALHSYGQVLMYPWGYTDTPAPNTPLMKRAGQLFARAAGRRYKTQYSVVNSATGFYYASGATDDWAKEALETPFVYTLELRDKDGFVLPTKFILPTGNEVWKGAKRLFSFINKQKL